MSAPRPWVSLPRLRRVVVLVAEARIEPRETLRKALEAIGATVLTAGSGADALRIVRQVLPSAIVTDLSTPDGEGAWLVAELGKLASGNAIPVICLTRCAHPIDALQLREMLATATGGSGERPFGASVPLPAGPPGLPPRV